MYMYMCMHVYMYVYILHTNISCIHIIGGARAGGGADSKAGRSGVSGAGGAGEQARVSGGGKPKP